MMEINNRKIQRRSFKEKSKKYLMRTAFLFGFLGVLTLIYDFGFDQPPVIRELLYWVYVFALSSGVVFIISCYLFPGNRPGKKIWLVDAFLILYYLILMSDLFGWFSARILKEDLWINMAIIVFFIRELSTFQVGFNRRYLNPAQLFILSFISIIIVGTLLLLLPNSTYTGISLLNALFTSTSAVCVTGLIVVDTGSFFTSFGQTVILILIQTGGIGIMTFTSYFGYFFKGGASYQNRLMIQDMTNSERIAEVFSTLKKIIFITFLIEVIGAIVIYSSLDSTIITVTGHRIFFSVFHSVSGFCNAGFSTLSNSLYETGFRFNYMLHVSVALLFIIGGLGFPIVFNTLAYLRHLLLNHTIRKQPLHLPWIIGINARIVLLTTLSLLVTGTVLFYMSEYNNTLAEHKGIGKLVTAFFSAATPRTAGFNTVDTSALNFSTVMIVFALMWIGASPGSTGGGIKTSTFAIAILNFLSIAKGKDRIEVYQREISPISTRRAFAIMSLSLIVIATSVVLLSVVETGKEIMPLAFESLSAFSTVGLSLGITSELSNAGKIIIILTMFIGRVSMLTILVAFMRRMVNLKYKYPTEDVLIN